MDLKDIRKSLTSNKPGDKDSDLSVIRKKLSEEYKTLYMYDKKLK